MGYLGLALVLSLIPKFAGATPEDLNIDYSLKSKFIVTNSLHQESSSTGAASDNSDNSNRTLGLSYLALQLDFQQRTPYFRMELRPDAGLVRSGIGGENREFDSRSGQTYRSSPIINLLDTYEVGVVKSDSFRLSYGVRKDAYQASLAYDAPLAFGLDVWFPKKFASLGLAWWSAMSPQLIANQPKVSRYYASLYTIEDDDDRHEFWSKHPSSDDTAPVAADPYTGLGGSFQFRPSNLHTLTLFAAYHDSKVDYGRKNRLMAAIHILNKYLSTSYPMTLSIDGRYSRERWHVDMGAYPQLEQHSLSLKSRIWLTSQNSLLAGFSQGISQRPLAPNSLEKSIHSGYQVDLGFQRQLYDSLLLSLQITGETRTIESNGTKFGGFRIRGENVERLNRMALELTYLIL